MSTTHSQEYGELELATIEYGRAQKALDSANLRRGRGIASTRAMAQRNLISAKNKFMQLADGFKTINPVLLGFQSVETTQIFSDALDAVWPNQYDQPLATMPEGGHESTGGQPTASTPSSETGLQEECESTGRLPGPSTPSIEPRLQEVRFMRCSISL
ncbi:hypothetical protein BDN70DRAFT_936864 [Pholiota conissans]|uniref:Uncharacterized protein n=1 Tax=Pholiota conissans TaxID=109636 RepID=A0A9P5YUL4_9AGAR|nr:hypothetical protein BDN70DRAFT_936864 [Pholiota conissans]